MDVNTVFRTTSDFFRDLGQAVARDMQNRTHAKAANPHNEEFQFDLGIVIAMQRVIGVGVIIGREPEQQQATAPREIERS
jgi:hypothetical protein